MADAPNELLTGLLKDVSRSFYLTLRVLPNSIRPQIGLAYLLARTTDTIADTGLVPLEQRLRLLQALRDRILGACGAPLDFGAYRAYRGIAAGSGAGCHFSRRLRACRRRTGNGSAKC